MTHPKDTKPCVDCGMLTARFDSRCQACTMKARFAVKRVTLTPPNPSGLCMCGCGQPAPIAADSNASRGYVKGFAVRYISGHNKPQRECRPVMLRTLRCGSVLVSLTKGRAMIIDADAVEMVTSRRWQAQIKDGVWRVAEAHILVRQLIAIPSGEVGDHINGNPLDNRRKNLRPATRQQNSFNQHLPRTRLRGITPEKSTGNYRALIRHNYQRITIGTFGTAEEAARAYDAVAIELFGEFAQLNFSVEPV